MKRVKQVEAKSSGIFHIVNEAEKSEPQERESPGGYFFEKSRKTELYRLKAKEDSDFHKLEEKKQTWWQRVKTWFNS
jgi:hypothetical protein